MIHIKTQLVDATPAYRVSTPAGPQYISDPCWPIPRGCEVEEGYKVEDGTGLVIWIDKPTFDAGHLPLTTNPNLRTDAPSISQEMVDAFIDDVEIETLGEKTTVVRAILRNGFEIVESSSCVSAENYDEEIGAQICLEKIKDKVWFLLGFLLQTAVHGVRGI